jgi:lipoprotein-anchoring transpeptidase ErfK/SrfK
MPEMQIRDFDDLKYPNRKPWLFVLAVAAGVGLWVLMQRMSGPDESPQAQQAVEISEAVALDPLAGAGVAVEPDPTSVVPMAADAQRALRETASQMADQGDLAAARVKYLELLQHLGPGAERDTVEAAVAPINVELVMTPRMMPEKVAYIVQAGDSCERIARQFGTTVELICKSNMLKNANLIKAGDRLRILKGTFEIVVNKTRNDLVLTFNDSFFKRYTVGTGKFGKTPVGEFVVRDKIPEPVWWRPDGREIPYGDPENILGTRWMALRAVGDTPDVRGYGIHGTWDETSIGMAESAGCVRMRNAEVEELFAMVPLGTRVVIEE